MISMITKMVPKKYYIIDGVELPQNEAFIVLETIVSDGDSYDLDYELYDCANKLVELGYLSKRYSYHQSTVFIDTEDKNGEKLFKEILEL